MRAGILCFTDAGERIAEGLLDILQQENEGNDVIAEKKSKYPVSSAKVNNTENSLSEWTKRHWDKELLIFIGATGIAVRGIAPYVKSKAEDPAVLVIDEQGRFCISLLSGHIGGGNEYVEKIAKEMGAVPVITTATDLNEAFAVDLFAKENQLEIPELSMIKVISSAVLKKEEVGLISELPILGEVPKELTVLTMEEQEEKKLNTGIYIGIRDEHPFAETMQLVPKIISVGMGCRKNVPVENAIEFLEHVFGDCELKKEAVFQLSSIDVKKDEACLHGLAKELSVPFITYDLETLQSLKGEFRESPFVKRTVGVGNVCERSALVPIGEDADLLFGKMTREGMTMSLAVKKQEIRF